MSLRPIRQRSPLSIFKTFLLGRPPPILLVRISSLTGCLLLRERTWAVIGPLEGPHVKTALIGREEIGPDRNPVSTFQAQRWFKSKLGGLLYRRH